MSKEEPRFSVMLTRSEVETIMEELDETTGSPDYDRIERLERRLRQRDTHEAQEQERSEGQPAGRATPCR